MKKLRLGLKNSTIFKLHYDREYVDYGYRSFHFATLVKADDDDEAAVEDEAEEEKPKTQKVTKTVWDWEL